MNVDKIIRMPPREVIRIQRGEKTEARTPINPQPKPSPHEGGCGWVWYPDATAFSHYVWNDTRESLLRSICELPYSPLGVEGNTIGIVSDNTLANLEDPRTPVILACKAKVIRSWAHRLGDISYDSCVRMGIQVPASLPATTDPETLQILIDDARMRAVEHLQGTLGRAVITPDTIMWATQFEVTEVLR